MSLKMNLKVAAFYVTKLGTIDLSSTSAVKCFFGDLAMWKSNFSLHLSIDLNFRHTSKKIKGGSPKKILEKKNVFPKKYVEPQDYISSIWFRFEGQEINGLKPRFFAFILFGSYPVPTVNQTYHQTLSTIQIEERPRETEEGWPLWLCHVRGGGGGEVIF